MELRAINCDMRYENLFDIKEIENHLKLLIELDEENFNLTNDYEQVFTKV